MYLLPPAGEGALRRLQATPGPDRHGGRHRGTARRARRSDGRSAFSSVPAGPTPGGRDAAESLLRSLATAGEEDADLEAVARPLLEALSTLTGLESTYLTHIRWSEELQEILYARNTGDIEVPEGIEVLGGVPSSSVSTVFPTAINLMRVFATIIADRVLRERRVADAETRAATAQAALRQRIHEVAQMQHALKTPVSVIAGWTKLLIERSDRIDHVLRGQALGAIARAAEDLTATIEGFLDEAAAIGVQVQRRRVDVVAVVRDITEDLDGCHRSTACDLCCSDDHLEADTDPRMLRLIVEHLVDNAIKYSPDGGTVTVTLEARGGDVLLSVADEGIGIDEEDDLFGAFARGRETTTTAGVGLGLHIVQRLARALGGEAGRPPQPGSRLDVPCDPAGRDPLTPSRRWCCVPT